MALTIKPADLSDPAVVGLLATHAGHCEASSPKGSCHYFDVSKLKAPGITVWAAYEGDTLFGVGALAEIGEADGEVKSMHTAAAARRKGVGQAILAEILAAARARGYTRLWLETGSNEPFAAARALYARNGFTPCPPFGSYVYDPFSSFFTLDLMMAEA
ncbi:GNAT family N-acetyltransferase [Acuticoccus yangtzensis]|uniref:GNAT family N-acetyltransferase n=1 Tax=Acuticoccus yangtzensis TaxID=1443441 RepID=UPI000949ACDB|nr:GNAT family N-acetyltransferase [Acuticoccus yangtzensis]